MLTEGRSPVGSITAFGSGCRPDADRALRKAMVESVHCRMYIKSLIRDQPHWRAGWRFRNVTSFETHARFYSSHPEHRRALDAWWNSARTTAWPLRAKEEFTNSDVHSLVADLTRLGHEVLLADLTTLDVRALGLRVVRVLVPGLQPLHGRHGWPHLGGTRLRKLSEVFGPEVRTPRRWNPFPHPCP